MKRCRRDERDKGMWTVTKEHDTVEDVGKNADAEDDRVEVADESLLYGGDSLKGDGVIGVVLRNKMFRVTKDFAYTIVCEFCVETR